MNNELTNAVKDLTVNQGKTGLSMNDLNNRLHEQLNSKPNNQQAKTSSPYNGVGNGVDINGTLMIKEDPAKAERFNQDSDAYLAEQIRLYEEYRYHERNLIYYARTMTPQEFEYNKFNLANYYCARHREVLARLYHNLSAMSKEDQALYHKIAIPKQVEILHRYQYDQSSDIKKYYDAMLTTMQNQINAYHNMSLVNDNYDKLIKAYDDLTKVHNQYMNNCDMNNNGYLTRVYSQEIQKANEELQSRSYLDNMVYDKENREIMFNTNRDNYNNPNFVNHLASLKFNNPLITEGMEHIVEQMKNDIRQQEAARAQQRQMTPESYINLGGYDKGVIRDADSRFQSFGKAAGGDNRYNPYTVGNSSSDYKYRNNPFVSAHGKSMVDPVLSSNHNSLAMYKNDYIREMRRIGYVPEMFGYPINNDDYLYQLIWATPVPDPNNYSKFEKTPTWYMSPEELGYLNYVEYNADRVKSIKASKNKRVFIWRGKRSEYESEEAYQEAKQKARENVFGKPVEKVEEPKNLRRTLIIFKTPEAERKYYEKLRLEEEKKKSEYTEDGFKRRRREVDIEEVVPMFTSNDYVSRLRDAGWIPPIVVRHLSTFLPCDIVEFCDEGLKYLYVNKPFIKSETFKAVVDELDKRSEKMKKELVRDRLSVYIEKLDEQYYDAIKAINIEFENPYMVEEPETEEDFNRIIEYAHRKIDQAINIVPEAVMTDEIKFGNSYQTTVDFEKYRYDIDEDFNEKNYLTERGTPDFKRLIEDGYLLTKGQRKKKKYNKGRKFEEKKKKVCKSFVEPNTFTFRDVLDSDVYKYLYKAWENEDFVVLRGRKFVGGRDLGDATEREKEISYKRMEDDFKVFSRTHSLKEVLNALDVDKQRKNCEELRDMLNEGLNGRMMQSMDPIEKFNFLKDQTKYGTDEENFDTNENKDMYTVKTIAGIFTINKGTFALENEILVETLNEHNRNQYLSEYRKPVNPLEIYYDDILLPQIKPSEKAQFETNKKLDDYNEFMNDMRLLREDDERQFDVWKKKNAHPLYCLNRDDFALIKNYNDGLAKYSEIMGVEDPTKMDYKDWVMKISKYANYLERKDSGTDLAITQYDIIKSLGGYGVNIDAKDVDWNKMYLPECNFDNLPRPKGTPIRKYPMQPFIDRFKVTCNRAGNRQCWSNWNDNYVDFVEKIPPIQYTGDPNGIFL